jgi:hypothetical protein
MIQTTAQELDEAEKIITGLVRSQSGSSSTSTNQSGLTPAATNSSVIQTSPNRLALMSKLNQLRFDSISFTNRPLFEVLNELSAKTRELDREKKGIRFSITPAAAASAGSPVVNLTTGLPKNTAKVPVSLETSRISLIPALEGVRLVDVLDAIVTVAERPLRYSINESGIAFSEGPVDPPQLHVRTFNVNPDAFANRITGPDTNASAPEVQKVLSNVFTQAGVAFDPGTGRNIFYGDRNGRLMIRAKKEELDKIERYLRQNGLLEPNRSSIINTLIPAPI